MPQGQFTVEFVSKMLGVLPRTLQRRLAKHGTTFQEIVQNTRIALVPQFLWQSDRPLADVADLLGSSEISAFSRWHKIQYGNHPATTVKPSAGPTSRLDALYASARRSASIKLPPTSGDGTGRSAP
jgi:transcriptional regulator GlxA family with amidase domain